jgi:hypothetical protein
MKHLRVAAAALTLALAAPNAVGQPNDRSTITVQGRQEAVQNFVSAISVESGAENQLARWDQRVCPSVTGLSAAHGQAIADHIAAHALRVGLGVGEPGCRANILVYVSNNSDRLTRELVANDPMLFAQLEETSLNTRGRDALTDFTNAPRPVRWWHVARTVAADGFDAYQGSNSPVVHDTHPAGMTAPGGASRIARYTRQDFSRVVVIIDSRRIGGTPVGALGEYVAMVALAQINPSADTAEYPSILNLFHDGANRQTAMTDWDEAYLARLYGASRVHSQHLQENAIAEQVRASEAR